MKNATKDDQPIQRLGMGVILISLGVLFLLNNWIPMLELHRTWPFFLLLPAAVLVLIWIRRGRGAAPLVFPIILLLFFSGYFLWLNHAGWWHVDTTWPNFLTGPGLAFLGLYFVRPRAGLLVPAFVLLGLAGVMTAEFGRNTWFLGVVFMAAGVPFLLKAHKRREAEPLPSSRAPQKKTAAKANSEST